MFNRECREVQVRYLTTYDDMSTRLQADGHVRVKAQAVCCESPF